MSPRFYNTQCLSGSVSVSIFVIGLLECVSDGEQYRVDINAVTADTVDFHSRLMASCLSPTSVPFLACGGSGWPPCHLTAQCHVWAGAGWGPLPSPGLLLLLLHGAAPMGLGCGWGLAAD